MIPQRKFSFLSSDQRGVLEILAASFCFGFLGLFGRWGAELGINTGLLLTGRFSFAFLMLLAFFILFRPMALKISLNQFFLCLALGLGGYAVFSTLYFWSIERVSISLAVMLLYTYPLWVHLFSHLSGNPMSKRDWSLLAFALFGLGLLLWGEVSVQSLWGVLSGLGAAMTYSIYILISRKYQQNMNPWTVSVYVMGAAAAGLYLFHRPTTGPLLHLESRPLGLLLAMAIFCTILPLSLVLASLQKLSSSRVSLLSLFEPITAVVAAYFLFNEKLQALQILGLVIVLMTLFFKARESRRSSAN